MMDDELEVNMALKQFVSPRKIFKFEIGKDNYEDELTLQRSKASGDKVGKNRQKKDHNLAISNIRKKIGQERKISTMQ